MAKIIPILIAVVSLTNQLKNCFWAFSSTFIRGFGVEFSFCDERKIYVCFGSLIKMKPLKRQGYGFLVFELLTVEVAEPKADVSHLLGIACLSARYFPTSQNKALGSLS